jgi:F-type H+-transporting ATPase subunit delta
MDPTNEQVTVLGAGSVKARLAKVYAEALLSAAQRQNALDATGDELAHFVTDVLDAAPEIEPFLASPVVGKKAKAAALEAALPGNASDLLRGLFAVLMQNGRLDLFRGVVAAYQQLINERAGRVPVKVTSAVALDHAHRDVLTRTLTDILRHEPVLSVRIDPNLLGGLVVQVGDRVIDTSIRTRLQRLRNRLLEAPM